MQRSGYFERGEMKNQEYRNSQCANAQMNSLTITLAIENEILGYSPVWTKARQENQCAN